MAYITRTTGSPMTNQKKFTYSAWLKIGTLGSYLRPIQNYYDGNNRGYILFCSSSDSAANTFFIYDKEGGTINYQANTTAKFRDTGWYHVVYRVDSTQATQSDRVRFYVNGELQSMSISTNCNQNVNMGFNSAGANLRIGGKESGSETWKGLMSHVHFCDGYSYAPTEFGETDSTTGEWKIKTSPSVTYGNNGFWVFKDDAAVTDRSGEGNNFTLSGSITPTQDNPSNVFATLNPLVNNYGEMMALTQGNLTCESTTSSPAWKTAVSTLGMTSGKYYWEVKFVNVHNAYNTGVMGSNILSANAQNPMNQTGWTGFYNYDGGEIRKDGNLTTNDYGTYSTNDIMGVACDMDNYTISFYKNGVAHVSNASLSTTGRDVVFPASCHYQTNGGAQASYNFGNGYFGTTAVATNSGNGYAGAEGSSIFNYQPPTGYSALSTKGLNE